MNHEFTPIEGGLYITGGKSGFRIVKVLKIEAEVIHLRIYKNKLTDVPGRVDPGTLTLGTIHDKDGFGVGHQPTRLQTFVSWRPRFLQHALVEPEELEG